MFGYNGLGRHNRAPNVFALDGGRALYCVAALAVVYDPATSEQTYLEARTLPRGTSATLRSRMGHTSRIICTTPTRYFTHRSPSTRFDCLRYPQPSCPPIPSKAHDDDITCVALHPSGRLAVTGQCASAYSGTAPWLAVWEVVSKEGVGRFAIRTQS